MSLPPDAASASVEPPPLTMPGPPAGTPGPDLRFGAGPAGGVGMAGPPRGADAIGTSAAPPPPTAPEPMPQAPLPSVTPAGITPTSGEAPAAEWLDQVCPYLLSEDGTWRSTQPDPGHRCMAQDPPGELPPMFQERFCLSDRHVRCEWYKAAQEGAPTTADTGAASTTPVNAAIARPSSDAGGGGEDGSGSSGGGDRRRPLFVAAAVIGGFIVLVVIALLFGSDGDRGAGPGADATPGATAAAGATPAPDATTAAMPAPADPPADPDILIRYRVQEEERLERIATKFGIERRRRIIRANPGMENDTPAVEAEQIIIVPVPASMSRADIEAVEGFVEFVDEAGDGGSESAA